MIDPLGYKFSPDKELVGFLLEQEVALEQKHGIPFCPCRGLTKDRDENMTLGNCDGRIYAIGRRCGHMDASLDLGTLEGYIVTCPLHSVQFDITTGETLSPVVPHDFGGAVFPDAATDYYRHQREITRHIKICDIKTYPVRVDGDVIKVDV